MTEVNGKTKNETPIFNQTRIQIFKLIILFLEKFDFLRQFDVFRLFKLQFFDQYRKLTDNIL